ARQSLSREREQLCGAQRGQNLVLHFVEKAAARQRIDNLDRFGLFARFEAMDRLQQKPIWAGGKMLERSRGVGARGKLMASQRGESRSFGIDETVGGGPAPQPAACTSTKCPAQVFVRIEQVAGGTARRFGIGIDQLVEHR